MKRKAGFTLIELLVTVAAIGILASIAYPSYRFAMVKSNRGSAQATLMEIAQRQQQFLMDNRSYAGSVAALNMTVPADVSRFYTVTVTPAVGPPPTFTATATPISSTYQAVDGALSIDNLGAKTPAGKW